MADIYIGAETIVSPLGTGIQANFSAIVENRSGIKPVVNAGFSGETLHLAQIAGVKSTFQSLICDTIERLRPLVDPSVFSSHQTILIISSTKGSLDQSLADPFGSTVAQIAARFGFAHHPLVVSNACISGVLAINMAGNLIKAGRYAHAIVVGCDVISKFVLYGFQSLFAIGDGGCRPFDASRNGISLGEGSGAVVVSAEAGIFVEAPLKLLVGTSANDANHISGPSRTGEGLFRCLQKTMEAHDVTPSGVDFISAHGTATVFNDEMESIAFERAGLSEIPLNSFKGYFGHTLGAAGVIETAATMQTIRRNMLVKSLGFETPGTSKSLNIIRENTPKSVVTAIKTASGFGGGNAALILTKR